MRLRTLTVVALAVLSLAAPLAAGAQPAGRVWRIGYLSSGDLEGHKPWFAAFRQGLRDLGYVEGANVSIEQRYAAGQIQRLPALAAELVRLQIDILVAAPAGSALAAKRVTSTTPIVFMGEPDPVGTGLVASLARPGGNVTGLADSHSDLVPKRLDLLKQIAPSASRIGILWNSSNASTAPQVRIAQAAAPGLGLSIVPIEVTKPGRDELDRAFDAVGKSRLGGLLVVGDSTLGLQRARIAELSIAHRLPASGPHRAWAAAGLLMSYGADFPAMFRHGAVLVDKILKGASPAALPVEQPTKLELTINARTARALGLTIPTSVLVRADAVLE
jgi:putative ABC transport system substrate-binding protein